MNMTVLIIAAVVNGGLHIEQAYPMEDFAKCESVAEHKVVQESYPERLLYCVDVSIISEPAKKCIQRASGSPVD